VSRQKTPSHYIFRMCAVAALLLPQGPPAAAAELRDIAVEKNGDRYHLSSTTYFNVTQSQLYNVLIDYDKYLLFSSAFVEAENRAPDGQGRPQFYTKMEGCVLLFCRAYIRVGHLELEPEHEIIAIVDPEQSNFDYSRERWQLVPDGEGTILIYNFEMEPGFWVPPIVGPYVIKRALRSAGGNAVDRIEAVALGKTPKK
jgi:Polyketide cyclase / dehydrase and lipid transport